MLSEWKINGSGMSVAPVEIRWSAPVVGTAMTGRTVYSSFDFIEMNFMGGCIAHARQWINAVSAGSFNATVLDRDQLSYRDLSGINAEILQWPGVIGVNSTDFSIIFKGIL